MKRVLFVCVENSCRSQMAQGFAGSSNVRGIEAYSAGSRPSGVVNPKGVAAMKEIGLDISAHESKGFDSLPDCEWDAVVTMGCGDACPHIPAKTRRDWELPDPAAMSPEDFAKVRDDIRARVENLLEELARNQPEDLPAD
jgi:protein-tyrosine-phosphatase